MRLIRAGWLAAAAVAAALTTPPGAAAGQEAGVTTRLPPASEASVDLAVAWSRHDFPCRAESGEDCPSFALLARDDDFGDALGSAGARASRGGPGRPLLLTDGQALSPQTREELGRYGGSLTSVVVLGGERAVSEVVADELRGMGLQVDRLDGATRIDTAVAVAQNNIQNLGPSTGLDSHALLVRAYGDEGNPTAAFADALTVGSLGAAMGTPVLLTDTERLSHATEAFLRGQLARNRPTKQRRLDTVLVIGGQAAVSDAVVAQVEALGMAVERVAGSERAGTAVQVMKRLHGLLEEDDARFLTLVEGARDVGWAAGLPASGPVLLSDGRSLPAATRDYLAGGDGGTSLVCAPLVTDQACDEASALLGRPPP